MKDDKHIEKMIRESLGIASAPDGFTDKIMDKIVKEEMAKDEALRSVFCKYAVHSPSEGFAEAVVTNMNLAKSRVRQASIISKKAWVFIFVFVGAIFVYTLLQYDNAAASQGVIGGMLEKAWSKLSIQNLSFDLHLPEFFTNPLVGLSIMAISSLLFIDKLLHDRRISINI